MKKNRILKSVIVGIFFSVFVLLYGGTVYASEEIYFDDEGNLIYITYDKKATSSISYKAIGWILKRYDAPIDAPGQQYVIVRKIEYAVDDPENPGYLYCYFWSDKNEILSAVEKVSSQWRKQLEEYGSTIYIDNVMTVCNDRIPLGNVDENGICTGEVYYTFEGIKNARPWARPEFLKSYFDIKLPFPVLVQPPAIYVNKNTETYTSYNSSILLAMSVGSYEFGKEIYDVDVAIPSGEELYFKGQCDSYLYELTVGEFTGAVYVPVRVDTDYVINWVDTGGVAQSETRKVSRWYSVPRNITYTRIVDFDIWDLEKISVDSKLIGKTVNVEYSRTNPSVSMKQYSDPTDHISNGVYTFNAGKVVLSSTDYIKPSIPDVNYFEMAKNRLTSVVVRSDYLSIEGKTVLSDNYQVNVGAKVSDINKSFVDIYKSKVKTLDMAPNGLFQDFSMKCRYVSRNSGKATNYLTRKVNGVNVHTPVVCVGNISGEKNTNQAIKPEKSDLVLGGNIYVNIYNTGMHMDAKGYGIRDYSKYVGSAYVKFPFEVQKDGRIYSADAWISVGSGIETFKLTEDVTIGSYRIMYKVIAINGNEKSLLGKGKNYMQQHHGAYGEQEVNVIGRMFDLQVADEEVYVAGDLDKEGGKLADFDKLILPYVLSDSENGNIGISIKTMGNISEGATITANIKYLYLNEETGELAPVDLYAKKGVGKYEKIRNEILFDEFAYTQESNVFLWEKKYTLPADFIITRAGTDVDSNELFKGGYVLMVFEFVFENPKYKTICYINQDNAIKGYCNMWKRQGGRSEFEINEQIIDGEDGIIFVTAIPEKVKSDYEVNGTH